MIVQLKNNIPTGIVQAPSSFEDELLSTMDEAIKSDFKFVEDMNLYEYDGSTFNLIANWEEIKEANRIAKLPTFESQQDNKLIELNAKVNAMTKEYLAKYPDIEIESFQVKASEASLIMADDTVALTLTPYLSKLVQNNVEARNALAVAVDAKMTENAQMEAYAVMTRDAIKACTTVEELDAIEI